MPNTINIVQPKAEDGTPVSYVTRTNSIYKSDGSPLGDSLDAYMDEVDELSQNLAELQSSKLDASNYVKAQNGSFPLLLHSGELWLIAVNRLSAPDAYVCLAHLYNGTVQVSNIYKSTTFSVDTNSQGTLTFKYTGSTTGVQGGAYRLM